METFTVNIATDQVDRLNKDFAKAVKVAEKLGLGTPTLEITETGKAVKQAHYDRGNSVPWLTGRVIECVEVEITCPTFELPGYQIVAALDVAEEGNIVAAAPRWHDVDLPDWSQVKGARCDHCNMNRNRKSLVAIADDDLNFLIVGKSCLAEYVGHVDAWAIVKAARQMSQLITQDPFGGGPGGGGVATDQYLAAAVCVINRYGFQKGGGTRDLALGALFDDEQRRAMIADGVEFAAGAIDDAHELMRWIADQGVQTNDYMRNLQIAAARGVATRKTFGLLASLPQAFRKAQGWEAEQAAKPAAAVSEWVGEPKTRELRTAVIECRREFDGDYGVRVMLRLRDDDGNVLVWWTGEDQTQYRTEDGWADMTTGDRITGKVTVKKHDEFKGEKQTVVTRWKVDSVN